nr:MAG TPA: hypothetical protein [Caudoviricetes sp.]
MWAACAQKWETLDNGFMLERMSGPRGPVGSIRSRMCS